MTTIFERVDTALATLDPAVPYAMDDLVGELPDTFITYNLITSVGAQHADNAETAQTHHIQVNVMNKADLVNLPNVDAAMLAAGFTKGPVHPIPKDSTTSHYGLAKEYFYLDNE